MIINGVLLLNKSIGSSSNKELQIIKRIFGADKAGHTGTLDPLASGLLPVCFGEATKFSSFLFDFNKQYHAIIKLGETTTTYDREGEVTSIKNVQCNNTQIKIAIDSFLGEIEQIPPIYSAIKLKGVPLYKYARNNISIESKPRKVTIYDIKLISYENNFLSISVLCSKGTYIRSLAYDIGQKLGCGAYLYDLTRIKIGDFDIVNSFSIDNLKHENPCLLPKYLLPVDSLVAQFPKIILSQTDFNKIKNGIPIFFNDQQHTFDYLNYHLSLYFDNIFIGLGVIEPHTKLLKVKRLINIINYFKNL